MYKYNISFFETSVVIKITSRLYLESEMSHTVLMLTHILSVLCLM